MARPPKPPTPLPLAELDSFDQEVERALEHIGDLDHLGKYSPLAQPYFLGRALAADMVSDIPAARGEALRRLLQGCAASLHTDEQKLLEISYFRRSSSLENVELANRLNVAERTFYRMRLRAIKSLAQVLNQAVVPALRPEAPAKQALLGRDEVLARMLSVLAGRHSVNLTGPTGIGKSALAAAVLDQWQSTGGIGAWYTLRSHINDDAVSFVFALAHLLRTLGAQHTWRQLVADKGVADWGRTLALLRYDLSSIDAGKVLLCVDDMDVLQDDLAEHVQILNVLEELKSYCPVLLIGQRTMLPTTEYVVLAGLEKTATQQLLMRQGVRLASPAVLDELVGYTQGRPAMLLLYVALIHTGEDPTTGIELISRSPTFDALFHRIWRRLDAVERILLQQLAVFRMPAPQDAWSDMSDVIQRLQWRGLAVASADGGIQIEPHLHGLVARHIPADERPVLHLRAAGICEAHGDFLGAMYHATEGRHAARAVWLWFLHRNVEIERGRGIAALEILRAIALADLPNVQDRRALVVARSELYKLIGAVDAANDELGAFPTGERTALTAYVQLLRGQVREMQGQAEQALESYRSAIDIYAGLPQAQEVAAYLQQSFVHLYRLHDIKQAQRAAVLARARADAFLGDLETIAGRYHAALAYLHSALQSAEEVGDDLAVRSRIYSYLGALHGRLGNTDQSLHFIERAIACDRQRGDEVGPLYDQLNLAAALYVAERFEESYAAGCEGISAARRLRNAYLVSGLAAGVAEACCGLGRWEEAEHYAVLSLQQEEEFFRASACVCLALVRGSQQRFAEARSLLAQALEHVSQIGDRYVEASVWCATARIDEAAGAPARAAWQRALDLYEDLEISYEVERIRRHLASAPDLSGPASIG